MCKSLSDLHPYPNTEGCSFCGALINPIRQSICNVFILMLGMDTRLHTNDVISDEAETFMTLYKEFTSTNIKLVLEGIGSDPTGQAIIKFEEVLLNLFNALMKITDFRGFQYLPLCKLTLLWNFEDAFHHMHVVKTTFINISNMVKGYKEMIKLYGYPGVELGVPDTAYVIPGIIDAPIFGYSAEFIMGNRKLVLPSNDLHARGVLIKEYHGLNGILDEFVDSFYLAKTSVFTHHKEDDKDHVIILYDMKLPCPELNKYLDIMTSVYYEEDYVLNKFIRINHLFSTGRLYDNPFDTFYEVVELVKSTRMFTRSDINMINLIINTVLTL